MDTLPMFDEPTPAPLQTAGEPTGRRSSRKHAETIRWVAYNTTARCWACVRDLARGLTATPARQARMRLQGAKAEVLLCGGHYEELVRGHGG